MRLDKYLFEKKLAESRTRAANLIALKRVSVNGKIAEKPSFEVSDADNVEVGEDYDASLGGLKLTKALQEFGVNPCDSVCLDVGASNGGFTDVLIKRGAKRVYCLDVGECALPERLRANDRIFIMDRTNARFVRKEDFPVSPELAVIDVSFISLKLILKAVADVLTENGQIIALIKPQFECSAKDLTKNGVVKNEKLRLAAVESVKNFCKDLSLSVEENIIEAPHPFEEKNQEYLMFLKKAPAFLA